MDTGIFSDEELAELKDLIAYDMYIQNKKDSEILRSYKTRTNKKFIQKVITLVRSRPGLYDPKSYRPKVKEKYQVRPLPRRKND